MTKTATPADLAARGLPADREAERAVLACLLLNPRRMADVADALEVGDFTDVATRLIFGAMLRLHRRGLPIDATLLIGDLRDAGEYDPSGDGSGVMLCDLTGLFELLPTAAHCAYYVSRVRDMTRRRRAMLRGAALIRAAAAPKSETPRQSIAMRRATKHAIRHRMRERHTP